MPEETGFIQIGFENDSGETVERILDCLKSYCAEVTTADGETEDYELWGSGDWDGQQGFPVLVKKWDDAIGAGVGERFVIDAEHILIH